MSKFEKGAPVDLPALVRRKRPAAVHPTGPRGDKPTKPRGAPGDWNVRRRDWYSPELTLAMRVALAMAPGRWYARPDLLRLLRVPYGSVKARTASMVEAGLLERARDPDVRPWRSPKGEPASVSLKRRQPEWLFRLTAAGEELRRRASLMA